MTGDQRQFALEFIKKIAREVEPKERHNGYNLHRRYNGSKFGFVRYNVKGSNPCKYTFYNHGFLDDPRGMFVTPEVGNTSKCVGAVAPDDGDAVRYVIMVLESCYDNAR